MKYEIDRVLLSKDQIATRVRELGRAVSNDLEKKLLAEGDDPDGHADRVVMLPVMTGAFVFTADLVREMPLKLSIRLVAVESYPGTATESKGAKIRGAMPKDLDGRHVVIVDDIHDSGRTLQLIQEICQEQGAASVVSCVLLDKQVEKAVDAPADYAGFEIPDEFVVGYGLDYDGYFRNLPEIVTLKEVGR
ncbi:MAG: hypoxanthine phosphoribosyltransferase [Phycisphaerales bacterium]